MDWIRISVCCVVLSLVNDIASTVPEVKGMVYMSFNSIDTTYINLFHIMGILPNIHKF